ncbi:hypothetical protein BKA64DRAFT_477638 [Cadophora sp. MPI-SDFR-AT-0126]|nr:hypothetical protein BKA64DRAFT_477638 [Leotiomycetes sp. MPI-SDFR-AT-0126]
MANSQSQSGRSDSSPSIPSDTTSNAASHQSSISSTSTLPPPNPHDIDRWNRHVKFQDFAAGLDDAAKALFPNEKTSRYSSVTVLVLSWQDEDPHLPVHLEIAELVHVFKDVYQYDVEEWKIPTQNPHLAVNRKIMDFVEPAPNDREHLKIMYYAGHGRLTKTKSLEWTSRRFNPRLDSHSGLQSVQWSSIQVLLEQAENDVLILLDCCAAGTANSGVGNGVTELLAACSYGGTANGVGRYSFTNALIKELLDFRQRSSFSTGDLYRNIFLHAQFHSEHGRDRPAPVHLPLTKQTSFPRSIHLSVQRRPKDNAKVGEEGCYITEEPLQSCSAPDLSDLGSDSDPIFEEESAKASLGLLEKELVPRILFAVRLKENFLPDDLSMEGLTEWLRTMPLIGVEEVKIEAGFSSFSSLILISVPIAMQAYIPTHPAVFCLGPITSKNVFLSEGNPISASTAPWPSPMASIDEPIFCSRTSGSPGAEVREPQGKSTELTSCSFVNLQTDQHPLRLEKISQQESRDVNVEELAASSAADKGILSENAGAERLEDTSPGIAEDAFAPDPSDRQPLAKLSRPIALHHELGGGGQTPLLPVGPKYQRYSRKHDHRNLKLSDSGQAPTGHLLRLGSTRAVGVKSEETIELLDSRAWDLEKQHLMLGRSTSVRKRGQPWTTIIKLSDLAARTFAEQTQLFRSFMTTASTESPLALQPTSKTPRTTWMYLSSGPISSSQKAFIYAACGVFPGGSDILDSACSWYLQFLEARIREAWEPLLRPLLEGVDASSLTPGKTDFEVVMQVLTIVAVRLQQPDCSLTEIADALYNEGLAKMADVEYDQMAQLSFAAIGWITLLYIPKIAPSPDRLELRTPAADFAPEYQAVFTAYSPTPRRRKRKSRQNQTFRVLEMDMSLIDQPLALLLQRFGSIIPDRKESMVVSIYPSSDNFTSQIKAYHLSFHTIYRIAKVNIEWVDCLALHLEFDPATKTLAIFRFPSLCLLMACSRSPGPCSQIFRDAQSYWSEPDGSDAKDYFREVLLTYRLIFGMHSSSYNMFRQLEKAKIWGKDNSPDTMLDVLCGQSWETEEARQVWDELGVSEPSICYDATASFAFLGDRLLHLQNYVEAHEPAPILTLWHDKRDISKWWTFWTIVFWGGAAIFLGLLQVALQIFQLYHAPGRSYNF